MEQLAKSGIEFVPEEILTNDKTTWQIANDYVRTGKFLPYLCRNMDSLLTTNSMDETNAKDYKSKMCKNYLNLRNLQVPNALKEKREAVLKNMQILINDRNECDKVSCVSSAMASLVKQCQ